MKIVILYLLLSLLFPIIANGQELTRINRQGLVEILNRDSDTTYVVNFWATWCSPCVKEIAFFEELHQASRGKKLKVVLISLDFPDRADKQVIPFLKEKSIGAPVLLMTDLNYNSWINLVDSSWSGAIPATLIYNNKKRAFLEQELTREELNKYVNQIYN